MEKLEKEITKIKKNGIKNNDSPKYKKTEKNDFTEKKEIKYEQKSKFNKKDIFIILLSFISFYYYIKSFKGCDGTQSYCLVTLSPSFFYLLGVYIIITSLITLYIVYQILKRGISPFHLIYYIPILIYLLYFVDNGSDLSHHGSYNKMIFYVLFCSFVIIF